MNGRKVAIPLFGESVSPRCEYTDRLLIVEIKNGEILTRETVKLESPDPLKKVNQIKAQGISTLVCCGMSGFFLRMLEANSVKVIRSATFNVEEILESVAKGEMPGTEMTCGKQKNRHRRRKQMGGKQAWKQKRKNDATLKGGVENAEG